MKNKKNITGVVYSTNKNFTYNYEDVFEKNKIPSSQQDLRIFLERKKGGKVVSIIKNFIGSVEELKSLSKEIKSKCGVGGAVKNGDIIIQGNCIDKILEILNKKRIKAKKSG